MMKQKCLRNRDVVNEDRISELPEALLLKILSSVPTKNVIATSVLSKQWRSLWKMVPNLMFKSERHGSKHHRFSEIVSRSLLSHKAPVLESLHLVVRDESEALDVIGIAFAHNVRKLVLDLRTWRCVSFPNVLWSCDNTTLETLELKNSILLKFPSPVCFKSLKKLHLDYVIFDDEESVSNLFSGCPRLEDLFMRRKGNVDVETFTVDVPSLQRLTIVDYYGDGVGRCVIIAPSLKYLNISAHDWIESCLINAPEVVEAEINVGHSIENENILASLVSVKRLFLKSPLGEIKFPTGIIYHQLVSLELSTEEDWDLLPLMLESSPKLQILKLTDPILGEKDWHDGWEWSEPKRVPECLLFELETFVWTGYEWQREEEKEVALYILKNARRLKKAFISAKYIKPAKLEKRRDESLEKLDKRRKALEKLEKRREALEKLEKKREEALQKLEKRREALEKLEKKRKESLQKLDKRREALQKLEKRREALQKLDKRREALQKLGKRREKSLQKLGKRREESLQKLDKRREALEKLGKRREALEKLEKKREEALQKLEKRCEALEKLEKKRKESLQKLDKRREALQKLDKRREALQKLGKRREALQKLGKRREALQKLGKRREASLQKLGKRREESLQKLEKRREALHKLDKRLEEALEKLEKRREEALEKLEKRRVKALEKLASEVKVYNSSCHPVLKCEPYH